MRYYLLSLLVVIGNTLIAQDSDFVHRMQKKGRDEALRNIEVYNRGKIAVHQREVFESSKRLNQTIRIFLKEGLDTMDINKMLERTVSSIDVVKDGITSNIGTNQTQRNLAVSSTILQEVTRKLGREKKYLDDYVASLLDFRVKIDSLQGDSLVYSYSSDSLEIINYMKKLALVVRELNPVDSELNKLLTTAQALQLKVDMAVDDVRSLYEDIDIYSSSLADNNTNKELPYLWEEPAVSRTYGEIFRLSFAKEFMGLRYYVEENGVYVFILLVLGGACFLFLRVLKRQVDRIDPADPGLSGPVTDFAGRFVVRYPMLSAILLTVCIFQFIFPDPPFIFYFILWLIAAICLLSIMSKFVTGYWRQFWIVIGSLFILSGIDDMVLQTSRAERWVTAFLSLAGLIYAAMIHFGKHKRELKERKIVYFINFVFICELLALILNGWGRFNLSKTFMVCGYSGVIIAILFLWVIRLVNEGLTLALAVYKRPDRRSFFINFNRVGNKVHPAFYVVLVIGWIFLVGKNFYALKKIYDSLIDVLMQSRSVGDYKFSIMGMLEFFLILVFSVLLSRLVSIFTSEPSGTPKEGEGKRFKLGSYILLVRIFIICLGFFFAFAAAGISLDKITILFGALGVGIGLGLQGLVTNLVSGLILSFERPVNVGDLIELNGRMGTMRSIGFRSSIIASDDGSCIIIPNGELLSQQMVNWTMGKNLKRNNFTLTVAFGSDLEKVKALIKRLIGEDENILHYPAAEVFLKDFNQGDIDVEVVFWPKHISLSKSVKSSLIEKIDALFKKEGIVIPLPQQELYIHTAGKGSNDLP